MAFIWYKNCSCSVLIQCLDPGKQIPVTTETRTENLDQTGSACGVS